MGRVSKVEQEKAEIRLRQLLENESEEDKVVPLHTRAERFISLGFTQKLVCRLLGITDKSWRRARQRVSIGATVGTNGRPGYLTKEQENELEIWCSEENLAGRGPTIPALNLQARRHYHVRAYVYYTIR